VGAQSWLDTSLSSFRAALAVAHPQLETLLASATLKRAVTRMS
jgi:hypothetical protein